MYERTVPSVNSRRALHLGNTVRRGCNAIRVCAPEERVVLHPQPRTRKILEINLSGNIKRIRGSALKRLTDPQDGESCERKLSSAANEERDHKGKL